MKKQALIIGGGLGGLATALTLSTQYDVRILEKNEHVGGKMKAITLGGFHFDYGPNTLTMPHFFWQVIEPFGNAKELLPFKKIDRPTHHQLGDTEIIFTTNKDDMMAQLAKIDGASAKNYPAFLEEITKLYQLSEQQFLAKTFFHAADYCDMDLARSLLQMHPFQTLHAFLQHYFPHPLVQQLFGRFATYIGSSPYATPATFALIAYFELVEGTYYLEGGATTIASVFEHLLIKQGVPIHTNETVTNLKSDGQRIIGCTTNKGSYDADIVVCNADYTVFQSLLGRNVKIPKQSTSAYIELIGLNKPVSLFHHNVIFSADYEQEFRALCAGRYAAHPTVYSCYPYASDKSRPPALFVLINAPSTSHFDAHLLTSQVDHALYTWGITAQDIAVRKALPPSFIADSFLTQDGSIYGQASNTFYTSFFRPSNKDTHIKNLYYVGGTVHPGGGSPVVVKSGFEVGRRIIGGLRSV